jgi:hypothetical protein
LKRGRYCYWHNRLHTEHHFPGNPKYQPPILDSSNAVLLALNHLFRAQSLGMIDDRSARELRSTLRVASQTVRQLDAPKPEEIITDLEQHLGPGTRVVGVTNDIADSNHSLPPAVEQAPSPVADQTKAPGLPPASSVAKHDDNPIARKSSAGSGEIGGPFSRKPPQFDRQDFNDLVNSPSAARPLSREEERKLRSLVRNGSHS